MVFIIAEAGINHDGDIREAYKLVRAAARTGADAVKFQTYTADLLAEGRGIFGTDTHRMLRRLALASGSFASLKWRADDAGIEFMTTPFAIPDLNLVSSLLQRVKIASGYLSDVPFLHAVAEIGKPVILSTGDPGASSGCAPTDHVRQAIETLAATDISLLHCVSQYPAMDPQLGRIDVLRWLTGLPVGYSSHDLGIEAPVAAVRDHHAVIIEKHLTLDKEASGPDHAISLEPHEFRRMVDAIREVRK